MTTDHERSLGRPRDPRIDAAVVKAAIQEISESGLRNFSIARVADRAGVARATVYLRWGRKDDLILDALRATGDPLDVPSTGSLRGDLRSLVQAWSDVFTDPTVSRLLAHVHADQPEYPEIVDEYRRAIALPVNSKVERALKDARQRGEVRRDVDLRAAARSLVGALQLEAMFTYGQISSSFQRHLVDLLESALSPRDAMAGNGGDVQE